MWESTWPLALPALCVDENCSPGGKAGSSLSRALGELRLASWSLGPHLEHEEVRPRKRRHGEWLAPSPESGVYSVGIRDKGLSLLLLMLPLLIISLSICFLAHQHKTYKSCWEDEMRYVRKASRKYQVHRVGAP